MRQSSFSFLKDYRKEFGGSLLVGKRKTKRPLTTKSPIHLILKSDHKKIFHPANGSLDRLIRSQCKKFNIHIYDLSVNWSHIHLLIKLKQREDYVMFIKSLTSILSMKIKKFLPDLEVLFTLRPYTRIVSWGREFKTVLKYQTINNLEAIGLIRREKKKSKGSNRLKSLKE